MRRRDASYATAAELDRLERAGDLLSVLRQRTEPGAHRPARHLDLPADANSICPG
jgi:hypothetical protein